MTLVRLARGVGGFQSKIYIFFLSLMDVDKSMEDLWCKCIANPKFIQCKLHTVYVCVYLYGKNANATRHGGKL